MFICNNCNKECKTKAALSNHTKSCINNNFVCKYCIKTFVCKQNLKQHIEDIICQEHKNYLEQKKESELKDYKITLENKEKELEEYKNNLENRIKLFEEQEKQYKNKLENKNKLIEEKDKEVKHILELKNNLIEENKKLYENNTELLTINKTLASKVGNVTNNTLNNSMAITTYNLPVLTSDNIGDFINPIEINQHNENISNWCNRITDNGLKNFAFVTNQREGNIVFNENGKEIRDKNSAILSEKIASHPATKNKKKEIEQAIKDLKVEISYVPDYDKPQKIKQLKNYEELLKNIDKKEIIQKTLPKTLNHANTANENELSKFLNELVQQVQKDPYTFLFENPSKYFISNQYMIDRSNLTVLDDKNNKIKLTSKDIRYIIQYLLEHCISFGKCIRDEEIKAITKVFSYKEYIRENYLYQLQENIKIYTNINENEKEINIFISNLLDGIQCIEN